jgi:hypothetical protein
VRGRASGDPPAAPPPPPAVEDCGPADRLEWLAEVDELSISLWESGHGGFTDLHADLRRDDAAFVGVILVSHRMRMGAPVRNAAKEVRVPPTDVVDLLRAFQAGVMAEERPPSPHGNVIVMDTSRTLHVQIDAMAERPGPPGTHPPPHHVQFHVDDGEDEPQPWRERGSGGCGHAIAYHAREGVSNAYAAFAREIGVADLLRSVRSSP